MNKSRFLTILAALAAFATTLGGLDLSGILPILPDGVATALATALPLLAGVVHLLDAVGDFADDGKMNGSFKMKCAPLAFFGAILLALLMSSCGAVSTLTGQPVPSVAVQRAGGQGRSFQVAQVDVQRAESAPATELWGLISLSNVSRITASGK